MILYLKTQVHYSLYLSRVCFEKTSLMEIFVIDWNRDNGLSGDIEMNSILEIRVILPSMKRLSNIVMVYGGAASYEDREETTNIKVRVGNN